MAIFQSLFMCSFVQRFHRLLATIQQSTHIRYLHQYETTFYCLYGHRCIQKKKVVFTTCLATLIGLSVFVSWAFSIGINNKLTFLHMIFFCELHYCTFFRFSYTCWCVGFFKHFWSMIIIFLKINVVRAYLFITFNLYRNSVYVGGTKRSIFLM